ncbi:Aste57867_13332 [Aphanomyces stellatus]|uniref:Aste57867_13332 protein n=1 Tax=Aphanomyces stellatus TaxID=120398 RepID=A0A485KY40_9STRA|nr:hypothetical protein As57867_013283 [Aphanomyces stellatus]VFT90171.1 Aste57867_13332 [Aphanomyces stellatus]
MTKRTRWSPELIECISSFICHSHSFFSLLEAFSGSGDDDTLGHLRRIGQTRWPVLRLTDDQQTWPLRSVLMHYPCVQVELRKASDWTALAEVITPTQRLHVIMDAYALPANFESPMWKHWMTLLPIAAMRAKFGDGHCCTVNRYLVGDLLPHMVHLEHLEVKVDYNMVPLLKNDDAFGEKTVDAFFSWLANSSQLTSLSVDVELGGSGGMDLFRVTPAMLGHLIQWLQTRPVTSFTCAFWDFELVGSHMPAFYDALTASTSLRHLNVSNCKLADLASHVFTRPFATLETLGLSYAQLVSNTDGSGISTALQGSSVRSLVVHDSQRNTWRDDEALSLGLPHLARWLPRTPIKHLELQGMYELDDEDAIELFWVALCDSSVTSMSIQERKIEGEAAIGLACDLDTFLARTKLDRLALSRFYVEKYAAAAQEVAKALWSSSQLRRVDFSNNMFYDDKFIEALLVGVETCTLLEEIVFDGIDFNVATYLVWKALERAKSPNLTLRVLNRDEIGPKEWTM